MSTGQKLLGLFLLLAVTFIYSLYERQTYNRFAYGTYTEILKSLPKQTLKTVYDAKELTTDDILKVEGKKVTYVHIWGTWCAPCEAEFPELMAFMKKMENTSAQFVLVAVNDELKKVKKFLKKFGEMPKNVILLEDPQGEFMSKLGTVKVPETFAFNSNGDHVRRYVGSQPWESDKFVQEFEKMSKGIALFQ